MAKEYIDREAVLEIIDRLYKHHLSMMNYSADSATYDCMQVVKEAPAADVAEVAHGYRKGDVCFYGFHPKNDSLALVKIEKILSNDRGVAEVKFLEVFVDDTGNGLFNYLLKSENTMNASFKYLKNITPNCGAKMDGGKDDKL